MSGIVGLFHLDGRPSDAADLARMTGAMAHRGPDGRGHWREGPAGLGHLMLHTTPESLHASLPLTDRSGYYTITADARLDNRKELVGRLGLDAKPRVEVTDSELILAAYKKWGKACPEKLLGAFAFAVWDAREQRLFCARDHLGVKNVYFWHQPGEFFACASEIKALLSHPRVPAKIDEKQFAANLTRKALDGEKTVYKGVRRLPSGETMIVSSTAVSVRKYWSPEPATTAVPDSDEACAERFLELFREAVRTRLRSAFTVGSELSGGLDSSFVTCVARDLLESNGTGPLHTVSLVYEQLPECDERPYIEEVTSASGIVSHYASVGEQGLVDLFDKMYDYFDEGRAGGNHHLNWITAESARNNGVRILLTGQDGDSTVYHGWQYFKELAWAGRWAEFAREAERCVENLRREQDDYAMQETFRSPLDVLNAYASNCLRQWATRGNYLRLFRAVNQIHTHFGVPRRQLYRRLWRDLVAFPATAQRRQQHARAEGARRSVPAIVKADLAARANLGERLVEAEEARRPGRSVRESQRATFESPNLQLSLERFDSYAAACGIEMRHPFMDKRLVEYCLALPPTQSLKNGWTRVVMRRAMKNVVPESIRQRVGKTSLTASYAYLLLQKNDQRANELLRDIGAAGRVLDEQHVRNLCSRKDQLSASEIHELGMSAEVAVWFQKQGKMEEKDRVQTY